MITMRNLFRFAASIAILVIPAGNANSQTNPAPATRPAIDGILAAFQTHSLVGMHNIEGGDNHDLAQQQDFYAALVRDPRFARDVGNVVVEFGNAMHQGVMDRYVNGEDVPYSELRKVWTDTVGGTVPPFNLGYVNLFAQVRAINASLPVDQRMHVWLGEPPVDWSKVEKREDIVPAGSNLMMIRDNHVAGLIEREILARRRKALVIYGGGHFITDPAALAARFGQTSMAAQIAQNHPGAIFDVETYTGLANKACNAEFEKDKKNLSLPALLPTETMLGDAAFRTRCVLTGGWNIDAVLYLGPATSLNSSPLLPDVYLDGDYLKELQRRWRIMGISVTTSDLSITVDKNAVSPKPLVTHDDIDSRVVALAARAKANEASPEAERALRRLIAGFQKGQPFYDELAPDVAKSVRGVSARLQSDIKSWGALKNITFKRVGTDGTDIYQVEFEKRPTEWHISPLIDGKVIVLYLLL
ncbi:MAG TPA: hypothetical protein VJS47_03470 [Rhizomicrobium sp.]|nr:hypothetical protein [Rhizomicrobium sp.]